MNKSFFSFVLSCAMMLGVMTGCNKSTSEEPETLTIQPKTLAFDKEAANKNFGIESNASWTITCSATWLNCSPVSGTGSRSDVKVSVSANGAAAPRTGTVTVKTKGGREETVQVTQGGGDPFIIILPEEAMANGAGEDVTVAVTASGSWSVAIPNDKDWVSVKSQLDTEAVLAVAANNLTTEREAVITFKLDGTEQSKTFTLTQSAAVVPFIDINPGAKTISDAGMDLTISVSASGAWTPQVESGVSWLSVKSTSTSQTVLTIAANPYFEPRTAHITFTLTSTDISKTFTLTQKKKGVWQNVTEEVGLVNTKKDFACRVEVFDNFWEAVGWSYNNDDVYDNGNVRKNSYQLAIWTYDLDNYYTRKRSIKNGHLYQTVFLEAGSYRFDVFVANNLSTDPHCWLYFGAAYGNDLPDLEIVDDSNTPASPESKMLGCLKILGSQEAGGNGQGQGLYQVNFEVPEDGDVSLGFIAHFLYGTQYFLFDYVELWKYE